MKTGCANISFFRESMNISFILLLFPHTVLSFKTIPIILVILRKTIIFAHSDA